MLSTWLQPFRLHNEPDLLDAQLLLDWIDTQWTERAISVPDIANGGPNRIRSTERARYLVMVLADHGCLKALPAGAVTKGRSRREAFRIVARVP